MFRNRHGECGAAPINFGSAKLDNDPPKYTIVSLWYTGSKSQCGTLELFRSLESSDPVSKLVIVDTDNKRELTEEDVYAFGTAQSPTLFTRYRSLSS